MNERLKSGLFCAKTPAIGKVECALAASAAFCRENVNSLSFPAPATGVDRLRGLCSIPHTPYELGSSSSSSSRSSRSSSRSPLSAQFRTPQSGSPSHKALEFGGRKAPAAIQCLIPCGNQAAVPLQKLDRGNSSCDGEGVGGCACLVCRGGAGGCALSLSILELAEVAAGPALVEVVVVVVVVVVGGPV